MGFAFFLMFFLLISNTNATAATNIVTNPGCESGTTGYSGYQASLVTTTSVKRSGNYSCKVTSTSGTFYNLQVSSSFSNPTKGQSYTASAWVRSDSSAGKNVYIAMRESGGSTATKTTYGPGVSLTTQWQQVSNTYTVQATGRTKVEFYVVQDPGAKNNVFYADDLVFQLNAAPTPTVVLTPTPTVSPTAVPTLMPTATPTPTVPPVKTCVPTITSDTSLAPDLESWVQTSVIPMLHTWYPVVGDNIAAPDYAPACTIHIVIDPNFNGISGTTASTGTIVVNAAYARSNPSDLGLFIHESTHVIQNYPSGTPGWVIEGIADWTREYLYKDRTPTIPSATSYYTDGYGTSAYFLNWLKNTYSSTLIHKLNVAGHAGTYSDSIITSAAGGKTLDQLWTLATGQSRVTNTFTGISSKCVDIPASNSTDGSLLQIYTCNGTSAQQWTTISHTGSQTKYLSALGKCMDIEYSGTAEGTPVWIWDCNGGLAQQWIPQTNGTLLNPNSNKCLAVDDNKSVDGTQMRISTCNASLPEQQWHLPK